MQRVRHERQSYQQRHEDRQNFRHEHQRLLLDLGERLEQRDHHADHQSDHHQRRGHHHDGPDRIARHIEGLGTGHFNFLSFPLMVRSAPLARVSNQEAPLAHHPSRRRLRRLLRMRADQIGIFMMSSYDWITRSRTDTKVETATSVSATAVTTSITLALPDAIATLCASDFLPASRTLPIASFRTAPNEGPPPSEPLPAAPVSRMRARLE